MKKPEHFNGVLIGALVSCLVFYYVFGAISIFTFSNDACIHSLQSDDLLAGIHGLILENIPSSSIFYISASIGLALTCWLSYPIAVYPATRAVESWITTGILSPSPSFL